VRRPKVEGSGRAPKEIEDEDEFEDEDD